jgi:hypothetical protein
VPARHCYDVICCGKFLVDDLRPGAADEMAVFVRDELQTANWMRAQSPADPAAPRSDRPDHGPNGSFAAWPAMMAKTLFDLGHDDQAADLLRRCAGALFEGVLGQAYELWPTTDSAAGVRIAQRGVCMREGLGGAAFAEMILSTVFGFRPLMGEPALPLWRPDRPRPFTGSLHHVRWQGDLVRLQAGPTGVRMVNR